MSSRKSADAGSKSKKLSSTQKENSRGSASKKEVLDPAVQEEEKEEEKRKLTPREELLTKKVESVAQLTHQYAHEIEVLRAEAKSRAREQQQMIKYLEKEKQKKQDFNMQLKDQISDLEQQQKSDEALLKHHFKSTMNRTEKVFLEKKAQLMEDNKKLNAEVEELAEFKELRLQLAQELELTKSKINANESWHRQQLDELERKFLAARDRLEKDASARIAHSRKVYKQEVGKELDEDSRKVRLQNRKMDKDLKRQEATSNALQAENNKMMDCLRSLTIDLELAKQKDTEYNKLHHRQFNSVEKLQDHVKVLERSLMQVLREVEVEREERDMRYRREVEEAQIEFDENKEESLAKADEAKTIKFHARTVLEQRTEVEKFFMREISKCQEAVRVQRLVQHKQHKDAHNKLIRSLAGPTLPTLTRTQIRKPSGTSRLDPSEEELTNFDVQQCFVPGLNRIKLLRLLYAKINHSTTVDEACMPAHSFDVQLVDNGTVRLGLSRPNSHRSIRAPSQQRPRRPKPRKPKETALLTGPPPPPSPQRNTAFFMTEEGAEGTR